MKLNDNIDVQPPVFEWGFMAPKYWGIWLLMLLLRCFMYLPRKWVMTLGKWVGEQFYRRNAKRRHIVETNLALCFPEMDEEQRNEKVVEHFRVYGQSLVDIGVFLWGSEKRVLSVVKVNGLEEHKQLLLNKKLVVVAWHQVALEATASVMTMGGHSVAMMNRMSNPLMTWVFYRARTRLSNIRLVVREQGLRPLLKGLRDLGRCIVIPDEDFGSRGGNSVFVPFFDVPRSTLLMPVKLAKSSNADIVVCATRLDPGTGTYFCEFSDPIAAPADLDEAVWITKVCEALEAYVKLAPLQYMWTFRWFQSRPNGEPSPYEVIK